MRTADYILLAGLALTYGLTAWLMDSLSRWLRRQDLRRTPAPDPSTRVA
jgi:hypothetical protein